MSIRSKSDHLKIVHANSILIKEHNPASYINNKIEPKKALAKTDVRALIYDIQFLNSREKPNDLLSKRKIYLQCEDLIRELEIKFQCWKMLQ